MTGFSEKYMLLGIYYLLLWHWLYYWTDHFRTFVYLQSPISKRFFKGWYIIWSDWAKFYILFIHPFFSHSTSQNISSLVKAFGCSLLSCLCHMDAWDWPSMPFLTEVSSLFLHTAYLSIFLSLYFLSSSQKSYPVSPPYCISVHCPSNLRH